MSKLTGSFRFDSARHVYTVGQVQVPAISTVVRLARTSTDGPWMKEEHRERGKAVHAATLAFDLGATHSEVLARLEPAWHGFFESYASFRRSVPAIKWTLLEQPRVHRLLKFAGTADRVGTLNGYPAICELKTGGEAEWHGVQTAGQDILLHTRFGLTRRWAVYLSNEGRFKLREHTDSGDYLRFLQALNDYHTQEGYDRQSA